MCFDLKKLKYICASCGCSVFPTDMSTAGGQCHRAAYGFLCDASCLCSNSRHV